MTSENSDLTQPVQAMQAVSQPLPTRIGKYDVVRVLGEGATSMVYLCRDTFAQRDVAVKVIPQSAMQGMGSGKLMNRLFTNEASLAGLLVHPHIVQIYDASVDDDYGYIVMEYVDGGTLAAHTKPDRLLTVGDVIDIACKCARALEFASDNGVIHRDIKPANILLRANNEVKITDFGSAAMENIGLDATLIDGIGTPAYMSPEQHLNQPLNHQTDIYSLGVVMFMLLTGRGPFKADNIAGLSHQVLNTNAPAPSQFRREVPAALDRIVARALQRDTDQRYLTWAQFISDLVAMIESGAVTPAQSAFDTVRYNFLRKLLFFNGFSDADLWEILRFSDWVSLPKDTVLMREGEPGDYFCILVSGEVRVTRKRRQLSVIKAGECLGEMACLGSPGNLRTADVTVSQAAQVLKIPVAAYQKSTDACRISFERVFLRVLVERLIQANAKLTMI